MDNKDLKYYLKEIETTNSFNYLLRLGEELFSALKNKDSYIKRVQAFYEYFQRDDYVRAFNSFLETTIKLISKKYEISIEDEPYLKVKFLVCTDIINTFFDEMCISDGLVSAYLSISLSEDYNKYCHAIACFISDSEVLRDVDYFLFDVVFNIKSEKDYYKYAKEMNSALLIYSMKQDKKLLNMLKIVLLKLLKDDICVAGICKATKEIPLNKEELEILKIREFCNNKGVNITQEEIGRKMTPRLRKNNVSQKVKDIKQKLGANSIDDAIRILESEEYNYRFER